MKAWSSLGLAVVSVGGALLLATTDAESQNQRLPSVLLQPATPGFAQAGHANISGTMTAGQFAGGGGGLVGLNAANVAAGTLANARTTGTPANLGNALVLRDPLGNFAAGTISATFSGTHIGDGSQLSNLNASSIASGTLADGRLSTHVALLNAAQTFSAIQTFAATAKFSNATLPFTVTATALVTNLNADLLDGYHAASFARLDANNSWTGANTFSHASNSFTGSGAGLTALNASNVSTGTLTDARLSSNVALLNLAQTFSAVKTFSASPSFTNAAVPFAVSSTNKVGNLNADLLDGYNTGNGSGQIPLSNGTVNTNLNADLHDGYHAGNGSGQIPLSNGTVNTNLNADLHDGYHAGNGSGQVPVSNGTVNTNLNADKTDGNHLVGVDVYTYAGSVRYLVNTWYCQIYAIGSSADHLRIYNPSGSGYSFRYCYSLDFGAPTVGDLSPGQFVDTADLWQKSVDIRVNQFSQGGKHVTFMGMHMGNGWVSGHVIYTD